MPAVGLAAVVDGSRPLVVMPHTNESVALTNPLLINLTYATGYMHAVEAGARGVHSEHGKRHRLLLT